MMRSVIAKYIKGYYDNYHGMGGLPIVMLCIAIHTNHV